MAVLLTSGGTRNSVIFLPKSTKPEAGALIANRSRASLLFGSSLVVIEIPIPTPEPRPVFTVPPDFIFPAAIVGDEIQPGLCPESSTLPQRVIKLLLDGGVLHYSEHPEGIQRALPFLESNEYTTYARLLSERSPSVVHNYPKAGAKLPAMAIVVGEEKLALEEKFLYDFAKVCVDQYGDVNYEPIDVFTAGFDSELSVFVYAENADESIFWYEVAKFVLQQARNLLTKVGIDNLSLSGQDLYPDPAFLPEYLYLRQLNLSFRTRQVFATDAPLIAHVEAFVQTIDQTVALPR